MGSCSSTSKVAVTNESSTASRYAVGVDPVVDNIVDVGGGSSGDGGKGGGEGGDFGFNNLEDIKDNAGDNGENDGDLGDGQTFEVDDVAVDESETAEAKLREYREELKKKGVGTRKKKSINKGLVMAKNDID